MLDLFSKHQDALLSLLSFEDYEIIPSVEISSLAVLLRFKSSKFKEYVAVVEMVDHIDDDTEKIFGFPLFMNKYFMGDCLMCVIAIMRNNEDCGKICVERLTLVQEEEVYKSLEGDLAHYYFIS